MLSKETFSRLVKGEGKKIDPDTHGILGNENTKHNDHAGVVLQTTPKVEEILLAEAEQRIEDRKNN